MSRKSRRRMNVGTAGPRGGRSPAIESRQPRALPRSRREVLVRKLAAATGLERDALRAALRSRGTADALGLLAELERRWEES